jgi:molecular chaperone DnaJ
VRSETVGVPVIGAIHASENRSEVMRVTRPGRCQSCQGTGAQAGTTPRRCEACGGTGQHATSARRAGVSVQQISPCPVCGARGHIIEQPCAAWGGQGEVPGDEALTVTIPVGVEEGMVLRLPAGGCRARRPAARLATSWWWYVADRSAV